METPVEIKRTPEVIAKEINGLKQQALTQMLLYSIEIGRRLIEVKDMLPHGEWGPWLKESVDYSHSTANYLMRVASEYGTEQWALFGAEAKSQALANLNYTQAVALLALPAEEREQFAEENDVENMSTRELQKAIKERDEAIKKAEDAQKKLNEQAEENRKLQDTKKDAEDDLKREQEIQIALNARLEETQKKLTEAEKAGDNDEVERLKLEIEEADAQLSHANEEIAELNKQITELKEKPIDVQATVGSIPEEVEQELADLKKKAQSAAVIKYKLYFENLIKGFNDLLSSLTEIQEQEPDLYGKYQQATMKMISQMSERV